jgi:hypothetical protein
VKKVLLVVIGAAVLFLLVCGTAFAATPQDIYDDYADNGKLDGTYTTAELNAYLNDATLHQYPPDAGKVDSLDALVKGMIASRNKYPFTGTEIALVAVGVVALLGIGLGIRRLSRARS